MEGKEVSPCYFKNMYMNNLEVAYFKSHTLVWIKITFYNLSDVAWDPLPVDWAKSRHKQ